ncbi:hypothetical protein TWF694_006397 [Orbilia ellipsospora]|uniref:Uncharacterized protein n=1 Tax=Orbilia ellipsospora TaxID=2528407 RepID=A0AAV9XMJ6_9PEZI
MSTLLTTIVITPTSTSTVLTTNITAPNKVTSLTTFETTPTITTLTSTVTTYTPIVTVTQTLYALQLTSDIINAQFKRYFLTLMNTNQLGVISDFSQAAKFYADSNGNITAGNGVLFAITSTSDVSNIFEQVPGTGQESAPCWIDSNNLFQCQSSMSMYMPAYNSTSELRLFTSVSDIFPLGCSGPLIVMAVPFPTAAKAAPAAQATRVIFQDSPSSRNIFAGNYLAAGNEDSNGMRTILQRLNITGNRGNAAVFLADPINGNLFSTTNAPFISSNLASRQNVYLDFPDYTIPDQYKVIFPCTLRSDLTAFCKYQNWSVLGGYNGTILPEQDGRIQIFNISDYGGDSSWVAPINLVGTVL